MGGERKVGQERAKQIDIWTEWKRSLTKKKNMKKVKINIKIIINTGTK
jgi:hypothetical protein